MGQIYRFVNFKKHCHPVKMGVKGLISI